MSAATDFVKCLTDCEESGIIANIVSIVRDAMDYFEMAEEFLIIRAEQLKTGAGQQLTKLARGGEFFAMSYLLVHDDGAYPKELSREMAVSSARITALLHHMEKKGWVLRAEDARDSRQIRVTLTDAGRAEILSRREKMLKTVASALQMLGPEDAEAYLRIQRKMVGICLRLNARV